MFDLVLRYKGFVLRVPLKNRGYYSKTEVEPGKTLYDVLFRELVDRKGVTPEQTVLAYKKICPSLDSSRIRCLKAIIQDAAKKSPDARISQMSFIKRGRGYAGPSLIRKSASARYTAEEIKIIQRVNQQMSTASAEERAARIRSAFAARGFLPTINGKSRLLNGKPNLLKTRK